MTAARWKARKCNALRRRLTGAKTTGCIETGGGIVTGAATAARHRGQASASPGSAGTRCPSPTRWTRPPCRWAGDRSKSRYGAERRQPPPRLLRPRCRRRSTWSRVGRASSMIPLSRSRSTSTSPPSSRTRIKLYLERGAGLTRLRHRRLRRRRRRDPVQARDFAGQGCNARRCADHCVRPAKVHMRGAATHVFKERKSISRRWRERRD